MGIGFFTPEELFLLGEGTWYRSYDKLGAHPACENGLDGFAFAVWAPGAESVHVAGSFNGWRIEEKFAMLPAPSGGVWHLFIPGAAEGDTYKYVIRTGGGELLYKADPYAFYTQQPPETSSRLADISGYVWRDSRWLSNRRRYGHLGRPLNIYEVHPGSWRRNDDGSYFSYSQMARTIISYALKMGYTHIELLPVMEHPFDGSWGYQITGYYAPTSRFGTPKEFMAFIDSCHTAGLGVILDWVPGHFCRDEHGLGAFNGGKLYEKDDHDQWGTYKFDFRRGEVRSFLISNAVFWLEKYHADGIRMDGVTSMLYLNFGTDDPKRRKINESGTEDDPDAVEFIRAVNKAATSRFPDVMMIAEESTAWPLVTRPPESGGLGFHYKWDMGWMNDTLRYMATDFTQRPAKHGLLTFSMMYAFNENFVLPLSHDEVVHGKRSLIGRMPGDYWRRFAGMRALAMYQICHPGAKLNFMGNEIAQFVEWRYYESLEWFLTEYESHEKYRTFTAALNSLYKKEKALWQNGYSWDGFKWLDADNSEQAVLTFIRRGKRPADDLVVLLNFRPDVYSEYRIGVPSKGIYEEIFNSDSADFGGSGKVNEGQLSSRNVPWQGQKQSVTITVPPIGGVILKRRVGNR